MNSKNKKVQEFVQVSETKKSLELQGSYLKMKIAIKDKSKINFKDAFKSYKEQIKKQYASSKKEAKEKIKVDVQKKLNQLKIPLTWDVVVNEKHYVARQLSRSKTYELVGSILPKDEKNEQSFLSQICSGLVDKCGKVVQTLTDAIPDASKKGKFEKEYKRVSNIQLKKRFEQQFKKEFFNETVKIYKGDLRDRKNQHTYAVMGIIESIRVIKKKSSQTKEDLKNLKKLEKGYEFHIEKIKCNFNKLNSRKSTFSELKDITLSNSKNALALNLLTFYSSIKIKQIEHWKGVADTGHSNDFEVAGNYLLKLTNQIKNEEVGLFGLMALLKKELNDFEECAKQEPELFEMVADMALLKSYFSDLVTSGKKTRENFIEEFIKTLSINCKASAMAKALVCGHTQGGNTKIDKKTLENFKSLKNAIRSLVPFVAMVQKLKSEMEKGGNIDWKLPFKAYFSGVGCALAQNIHSDLLKKGMGADQLVKVAFDILKGNKGLKVIAEEQAKLEGLRVLGTLRQGPKAIKYEFLRRLESIKQAKGWAKVFRLGIEAGLPSLALVGSIGLIRVLGISYGIVPSSSLLALGGLTVPWMLSQLLDNKISDEEKAKIAKGVIEKMKSRKEVNIEQLEKINTKEGLEKATKEQKEKVENLKKDLKDGLEVVLRKNGLNVKASDDIINAGIARMNKKNISKNDQSKLEKKLKRSS